ncbi:MAG TPA: ATP-binding cassette domain-containing protein [Virgibacillus sp.]|nr:ATP-binding cassette domain-containing protein [Virgibacillus sp.]
MSIIDVKHLKYKYPGTDKLILNDISFTVEKGEFIGVIGQNATGKSTLCFSLSGLIPHFFKGGYGGHVTVNDMIVETSELSDIIKTVGLVFENPFSQMTGSKFTVYEEIGFGLENIGIPRREMRKRIDQSLAIMNLTDLSDRSPFALSGGQMQRVAIASVIAMNPDILVLDEPTSQLDPQSSRNVFEVVEDLSNQGITIIMAEHNMEHIAKFADKVLLLHEGKRIDFDTPENIFSRDDLSQYGVAPPVVTSVARQLGIKHKDTGRYPILIEELSNENVVKRDG